MAGRAVERLGEVKADAPAARERMVAIVVFMIACCLELCEFDMDIIAKVRLVV